MKPKYTRVYVNGSYVGEVGTFDGTPRYLWLSKGRHALTLYLPGHDNIEAIVEVEAGRIVTVKDKMSRGVSAPPDEDPLGSS